MNEIEKISTVVSQELTDIEKSPFTEKGFEEFKCEIDKFMDHLFYQALFSTKRDKSDKISPKHVQNAMNYLSNINSFKFGDFFNVLGGILLRLSITFIVQIGMGEMEPTHTKSVILTLSGIIGSFLIAYALAKKN